MLDLLTNALPAVLSDSEGGAHINFLAIPVAAIASFVIGGLWYSPMLFAKPWKRLLGVPPEQKANPTKPMIISVIMDLLIALGLTVAITRVDGPDVLDGLMVGIGVWFVFVATILASNYAFNGKPFTLWLID